MSRPWQESLVERLLARACPEGGWGYRPGSSTAAEPTALACLALKAHHVDRVRWRHGLDALGDLQRSDGGVSVSGSVDQPCWSTGLAALAWIHAGLEPDNTRSDQTAQAVRWLLAATGRRLSPNAGILAHDVTLRGWPWVDGTHSWVEPTAYAILALRAAGRDDHPRTREGVRLLRDRAFEGGGWNYGNTRVLASTLRPFPATTGAAMAALAGEPRDGAIDVSITYLARALERVRAPMSLGWGLIGLAAWQALPHDADAWLAESALAQLTREPKPQEDALLLLAGAAGGPLVLRRESIAHG